LVIEVKNTKSKILVIATILAMVSLMVMAASTTPVKAQSANTVVIQILDPVGSGTTNPGTGTYTYDTSAAYVLTATPAAGWTFDHWEIFGDFNTLLGVNASASIQITDNPVIGNCGYGSSYQYQAVFVQPTTTASIPGVPVVYVVIIAIVVAAVAAIGAFFAGKKSK
jgi:hypothetical protein